MLSKFKVNVSPETAEVNPVPPETFKVSPRPIVEAVELSSTNVIGLNVFVLAVKFLFVKVCEPVSVVTVTSIATDKMSVATPVVVIPVPP